MKPLTPLEGVEVEFSEGNRTSQRVLEETTQEVKASSPTMLHLF